MNDFINELVELLNKHRVMLYADDTGLFYAEKSALKVNIRVYDKSDETITFGLNK